METLLNILVMSFLEVTVYKVKWYDSKAINWKKMTKALFSDYHKIDCWGNREIFGGLTEETVPQREGTPQPGGARTCPRGEVWGAEAGPGDSQGRHQPAQGNHQRHGQGKRLSAAHGGRQNRKNCPLEWGYLTQGNCCGGSCWIKYMIDGCIKYFDKSFYKE